MQKNVFVFDIGKHFKIKIIDTQPMRELNDQQKEWQKNLIQYDHCKVIQKDYDRLRLAFYREEFEDSYEVVTIWIKDKQIALKDRGHLQVIFEEEILPKEAIAA